MRHIARLCGVTTLCVVVSALANDSPAQDRPAEDCDRACLYGFVDLYMDALVDRDPSRLPLARRMQFSENSVAMRIGDGLWNTISGRGDYDLKVADVDAGQVGFYGIVEEHGIPAAFALRMRIRDRRIAEVETIITRRGDGPFPRTDLLKKTTIFDEVLDMAQRRPRARMISIADGYFDTLQLNDGTLFTQFDDNCNRVENGVQTTNNPGALPNAPVMALGCADQFRTGNFNYDDRLRARRFPLIDEERGLVMAGGFIDHSGRLGSVTLKDGTVVESPFKSPHSYALLELFKIVDGKILRIEAVFSTVTYNIPSPWTRN